MRRELRWALAATAAFAVGVAFAEPYARLAAPYYAAVDRLIAIGRPWEIISVDVKPGKSNLSAEVQLWAFVRRHRGDPEPAAKVQGRVQIGESVETPVIFWTLLLVWPTASRRERILRYIVGIPVFLLLEAITTATQLIVPMAQASAILAGDNDPVTGWDQWSRFLESGGAFVVVTFGALLTIGIAIRTRIPLPPHPIVLEP
jgi:hypothetical protein